MPMDKCSEATKIAVIEAYKNSKDNCVKSLAERFGLSVSTIHRIINNYFKELEKAVGKSNIN